MSAVTDSQTNRDTEFDWTGERYVPAIGGQVGLEHLHRYYLACGLVAGKAVLDIACGEGYGSMLLAQAAKSVVGVDIDSNAIADARGRYLAPNLKFAEGRCDQMPVEDASIDIVVSFETIEHHELHDEMIRECVRVLKPGGILIMSSPDRYEYTERSGQVNPFHVKELSLAEFAALLKRYFPEVRLYGQQARFGSIVSELGLTNQTAGIVRYQNGNVVQEVGIDPAEYVIAIAGTGELPKLDAGLFWCPEVRQDQEYSTHLASMLAKTEKARLDVHAKWEERGHWALSLEREIAQHRQLTERLEDAAKDAEARTSALSETIERQSEELKQRRALNSQAITDRDNAIADLAAIRASNTWKLTAPIRWLIEELRSPEMRTRLARTQYAILLNLRRAYHALPVSIQAREQLKDFSYRTFPFAFRTLPSYRMWEARRSLLRSSLGASPASPSRVDSFKSTQVPSFLPTSLRPLVSIVIPVYGKLGYTARCLQSIVDHPPSVPIEIIVVDDKSPDDSRAKLAEVNGLRLISNETNLGFIRSCNLGAEASVGDWIYLLNNDTEVTDGWLDELLRTFGSIPNVGLAGSKLIYPNGVLQEAGGIIWRDGSAWNYGKGADPATPEFNYARDADFCSGASLLIKRELFDELGRFDTHYVPAYGEDSDLALKIRAKGLRVIYQPMSKIIHHEGISSGTDLNSGAKAYQVDNARKLYERWRELLSTQQEPGKNIDAARDRTARYRVLVLDHVTPTPDKDAGSITSLNLMLMLQYAGYQVTFAPEDNFLYMPDYTSNLQRVGIEVLYAPFVRSVVEHVTAHGERYDLVLMFRPLVAERHLATIETYCRNAKLLYHTSDLHFLRLEREAELTGSAEKKEAARRMREQELRTLNRADAVIVHSDAEKQLLSRDAPDAKVHTFQWAIPIRGTTAGFEARSGLAFVGGYQHPPNVDAVCSFVAETMPELRKRLPGVRFHIVGSDAPKEVLSLACDDVEVTGFVENLGEFLDKIRVAVVPLRFGAGIKGKIATTLSLGLPSVATTVAVEGMNLTAGKNVLVADSPSDFVSAVVDLYTNPALWSEMSEQGLRFAASTYGSEAAVRTMTEVLATLDLRVEGPMGLAPIIGPGNPPSKSAAIPLPSFAPIGTCRDLLDYDALLRSRDFLATGPLIKRLIEEHKDSVSYAVPGHCAVCERQSWFAVDKQSGAREVEHGWEPNWRERLECPRCRLNNRQRLIATLIAAQLGAPGANSKRVYFMEQVTDIFRWATRFAGDHHIVGSEYLGPEIDSGAVIKGVRHENVEGLSFADGSVDLIISNDVFEHIPSPATGFSECARVLASGGQMLFTIPFYSARTECTTRALLRDGKIDYLLPAQTHGNPVSPDGSLVFTDFGWSVLAMLQKAGFSDAWAEVYSLPEYGHFGDGLIVFRAVKS